MLKNFFQRYSSQTMLVMVFLFPIIGFGALHAVRTQRNNVEEWLPEGYTETIELEWFREHFLGEQFAVVSWDGCTRDDVRLHVMARKLLPPSEDRRPMASIASGSDAASLSERAPNEKLFKQVITGQTAIDQLTGDPLYLDEDEAIERLSGLLIRLHRETAKDGEAATGDVIVREQTCLIVTLTDYGKNHLREAIGRITETAEESGLTADSLHMGGPPVTNYAIDAEGRTTLRKLAGWSGVVGLLLAYLCFRCIRLTIMVFSIGLYSAIASLGVVGYYGIFEIRVLGLEQASFGGVDAILMSMPSLVYVLAISGAIHIVNYYHDAVREDGRENAAATALAHAWGPCTLAALTTALGLLSLCISDLIPINKFGFWSAVGVLTTLVILFAMLPAWLHVWPPRERTAETAGGLLNAGGRRLADGIIRRNPLVAVGCAVVMIVVALGLTQTTTSVRLMKLFDSKSRVIADYTWLEKNLGNLVPMEIVLRMDRPSDVPTDAVLDQPSGNPSGELSYYDRMKLVADVQQKIEALPHVSKTMSAVSEAPPLPQRSDFTSSGLGMFGGSSTYRFKKACQLYGRQMQKNRDAMLQRDYLSEDEQQEFWRISCRVSALEDVDYGEFVETLKTTIEPLLQAKIAETQATIDVTYTGVVPLVHKSQRELLNGLVNSIGMAFVLIALVMMIVLRSVSAGLVSMLPNIFPIAIIFGAFGWLGIAIDIGTMMTASVAMGVAVDDTVHFLTWFRHGMKDMSLDRKEATRLAMRRCGRAMMQTTAVGGMGLLVFALSSFTPTQRFGYLMFLLLAAALVGDLVFLPALLSGPIGKLFGRTTAKPPAEVSGQVDEAQTDVPRPHSKTKTGSHIRADAAHHWSRGRL